MALPVALSFKNGIKDVSGFEHSTALVGSPTIVAGRYDRGLSCFTGDGMTVFYPAGSYYLDLSGGKSFACWVKADPGPEGQTRVLYDRGQVKVYLATSNGDVGVFLQGSMFSSGVNVCDGEWHHVMWSWDSAAIGGDVDDTHRWWIDGVKVAQTVRSLSYAETPNAYGYIGCADGGEEPANAVISDVRIWNDPVYENEATYLRDLPVTDYRRGLFAFNSSTAGQYRDSSEHGNHLTAGSGTLAAGKNGNALAPSSAWSASFSPGPMDRITVMFWLRIPNLSAVSEVFSLYAGSTEKFSMTHAGSGVVDCYCLRDTGSTGASNIHTSSAPLQQGVWQKVVVQAWASDMSLFIDDPSPGPDGGAGGGSVQRPINLPSFTGISQLRVGAGVQIDDMRIISNWIAASSQGALFNQPLYDTLSSGIYRGGGAPMRVWQKVDDGSLVELTVSGYDTSSDITPPSVPESLAVLGSAGATSFTLTWDASVDAGDEPDEGAPSVPTGLVESNVGATSFDLDWEESTDA